MFWNDIKEIRAWMESISCRLTDIQLKVAKNNDPKNREDILLAIRESIENYLKREFEAEGVKNLLKFEDYIKNLDKINFMVSEFKGCVSIARAALEERKQLDKQTDETKKLAQISKEIYDAMVSFVQASENIKYEAHYKIDYIYKNMEEIADFMHAWEKKSREKLKSDRKKKKIIKDSQDS